MTDFRYFHATELACRCCGGMRLQEGFLDKLIEIREVWNKPMTITSCSRCRKHNDTVGGKGKSFHLFDCPELTGISGTCAIDISTMTWSGVDKLKFVKLAIEKGWSVGIAKTFIHIDRRADYETDWPQPIMFNY